MTALTYRSPRLSVLTRVRRVWALWRIKCEQQSLDHYKGLPCIGEEFVKNANENIERWEALL